MESPDASRAVIGAPAWADAVAEVVLAATAAAGKGRRLVAASPDFEAWPWDRAELTSVLVPWLKRPGRSLVLLSGDGAAWLSRCPRFETWRRDWMHAIAIRSVAEDEGGRVPEFVAAEGGPWAWLHERDPWRGMAGTSPREAARLLQSIDASLQRSGDAGAVKVLGL
ncbi:MAG: hypothetical protein ACOVOT_15180 [Rubrivivax sp.]|jgi:hypothetical protein|nr:hypothetical protein [Rubrivivax sp.]